MEGQLLDLSTPLVMGVLNVTPDSFFDGGRFNTEETILIQAEKILSEGATFIDIGGYSSRPGAEDISLEEELSRSVKAIKLVSSKFPNARVSIDTFRSEVARQAVLEGACMINDISAGSLDKKMFTTVAELNVPYIAMHMKGTPQNMKDQATYQNPIKEIADYLQEKISILERLGVKDIIVDPGIGFAKTIEQNFYILNQLNYFKILSKPILVGVSRKSMIWKTLGTTAKEALNGTSALNMTALINGATILRVHDVKEAVEVVKLFKGLSSYRSPVTTNW